MQQLTQEKPATTFHEALLQLRQSLASADPLATTARDPFLAQAQALADTFDTASDTERHALLLRALDEAIAAIELAARLADAANSTHSDPHATPATQQTLAVTETGNQSEQTSDATQDPLFAAYRAFKESQPMYQELYHYRNALAERLRVAADAGNIEA